jgi:cell division protein FtsZ
MKMEVFVTGQWDEWLSYPEENDNSSNKIVKSNIKYFPKIKVVGCGGAGVNMLNNLVEMLQIPLECFVVVDTNAYDLERSKVKNKIQLGIHGQGSGSNTAKAKELAENSINKLEKHFDDIDFVVLFCGVGGGTGTGASPIIAQQAKKSGCIVMSFVTTPFDYEKKEWPSVFNFLEEIKNFSDFTNVISNNVLAKESNLLKAFRYLDEFYAKVLNIIFSIVYKQSSGIQHVLGADIADLKFVLEHKGYGFVTVGYGEGENAALYAVQSCFRNQFIFPLLKLDSAKSLMVNIISNENSVSIEDIETLFNVLCSQFSNTKINIIHSLSVVEEPSELFSSTSQVKKVFLALTSSGIELQKNPSQKSTDLFQIIKNTKFYSS